MKISRNQLRRIILKEAGLLREDEPGAEGSKPERDRLARSPGGELVFKAKPTIVTLEQIENSALFDQIKAHNADSSDPLAASYKDLKQEVDMDRHISIATNDGSVSEGDPQVAVFKDISARTGRGWHTSMARKFEFAPGKVIAYISALK